MLRRDFLLALGAACAFSCGARQDGRPPRIAAVLTTYFPNSHADVFFSRILEGYRLNGVSHGPRLEIASMYVDQFPPNDMARDLAI
jgi:hypothetical protein